jgi:hypothetical protein
MDELKVRAAVERIVSEAHGLYTGIGVPCRLVPIDAINALVEAVADELPEDVPTDRSPVT